MELDRENIIDYDKTRLATRPIPVADGWVGAENACFRIFELDHYRRTDQRTDKASYRVACPQLKKVKLKRKKKTSRLISGPT